MKIRKKNPSEKPADLLSIKIKNSFFHNINYFGPNIFLSRFSGFFLSNHQNNWPTNAIHLQADIAGDLENYLKHLERVFDL